MQSKQVKQFQNSFDYKATIRSNKFKILKLGGTSVPTNSIADQVEAS